MYWRLIHIPRASSFEIEHEYFHFRHLTRVACPACVFQPQAGFTEQLISLDSPFTLAQAGETTMANGSLENNEVASVWHSIRPWRPTLSLSVREITSVSATFVLSSPLATVDSSTDPLLASLELDGDVEDEARDETLDGNAGSHDTDSAVVTRSTQIISDVLSKGLSVKVNGTPWQRVLMKIEDVSDEAIIILFGLMPGRQYDIELGIVPGENTIRGQITTGAHGFCLLSNRSLSFTYNLVPALVMQLMAHVLDQIPTAAKNAHSHHPTHISHLLPRLHLPYIPPHP